MQYRLLGAGAMPQAVRRALDQEGILLLDEGIATERRSNTEPAGQFVQLAAGRATGAGG